MAPLKPSRFDSIRGGRVPFSYNSSSTCGEKAVRCLDADLPTQRLIRDHLLEVAAHGFETIEVAAVSGHFDPANDRAVGDLQQWLAEAGLRLHAVAAPPPDGPSPWTASSLAPVEQALFTARRIPLPVLVLAGRRAARRRQDR